MAKTPKKVANEINHAIDLFDAAESREDSYVKRDHLGWT